MDIAGLPIMENRLRSSALLTVRTEQHDPANRSASEHGECCNVEPMVGLGHAQLDRIVDNGRCVHAHHQRRQCRPTLRTLCVPRDRRRHGAPDGIRGSEVEPSENQRPRSRYQDYEASPGDRAALPLVVRRC